MNVIDKSTSASEQNQSTLDKLNKMIDGESPETKSMKNLIAMVSQTDSTALILGETGTGKDIVAQAIHKCSNKKGPFITVNCAAIPSELLESELFGHEKGSFTGADKQRKGRFEQSSGGSLFLDEIGDMPLPLQAKLLRAIESKTIQRVGGAQDIKIDLRLICATHRDLEKKVENGEFRADLFFRINVLPINVPSLAERRNDIPSLQKTLLSNLKVDETQKPIFTPDAITALCKHNWPGNVRELENTLYRAICTHLPSRLIFDGPYPYRGVVNAIDSAKGIKSIWIHSERTNKETIAKRVSHFTEIKKLNYLSQVNPQQEIRKRSYHALSNKLLLATEYGYHETNKKFQVFSYH